MTESIREPPRWGIETTRLQGEKRRKEMKNVFIINVHEYYEFSQGKLNSTLVERAESILSGKKL